MRSHHICGHPVDPTYPRRCRTCHNAAMRHERSFNPLEGEALKRANARSYLASYVRRGLIARQPCEVCGDKAQSHHDDYDKPLDVRWLCELHHLALHGALAPFRNPCHVPV